MRKRIPLRYFDKTLFLTPVLIFVIGVLSIYSASVKTGGMIDQSFVVRQLLWMGIAMLGVFLLIRVDYFKFQDIAWPCYFVSLFFLVLVLFMPVRLGAHRWISIAGFNFQPSELAKLSVILVLSQFFANERIEFVSRRKKWLPFLVVAVPFLLILKEPDLGTALTLIPILFSMLYLWGLKLRTLLALTMAAILASPLLFMVLKEYQKARLLVFINPNMDPLGAGYTIIQSKIAIGSGGLLGKGFMGGTQNQLQFIPERHTDFIFPVIAEEGGLLAAVFILALFVVIVKRGYEICGQTPDRFGQQLACGITTMIGMQTIINLGMTMGLLPVVGMPLPLVSYGGSSILITMLSIGILINIRMRRSLF